MKVSSPDPLADDPDRWRRLFAQFGHVSYVTVCRGNGALLRALAGRRAAGRKLEGSTTNIAEVGQGFLVWMSVKSRPRPPSCGVVEARAYRCVACRDAEKRIVCDSIVSAATGLTDVFVVLTVAVLVERQIIEAYKGVDDRERPGVGRGGWWKAIAQPLGFSRVS